ncbi:hypothetical protein JZ751_003568, partial [Albula glossodonta]
MAAKLSFSEEDLSCPVCCDIFRDPVVLQCSHSFCKSCLQQYWTQKGSGRDCPLCRSESSTDEPVVSLTLKNLCDAYVQENTARGAAEGEETGELCSLHGERLKLFCLEDGQPICVVCHTSRRHKHHECCPVGEAVLDCKALRRKWEAFDQAKQAYEKTADHIKLQAQQTEKRIKDEFEKLHHFLRAEEAVRLTALKEEEEEKSQVMRAKIEEIGKSMAYLSDTIRAIEEEMKVEDISLLHKFRTTMRSTKPTLRDPEMISSVLIRVASYVGSLRYEVWAKMLKMVEYSEKGEYDAEDHWNTQAFPGGRTRLCRQKTTGTHRRFQVAVPGCVGRRPLEHTGVSRWPYQAVSAEDHWNTQAFPGGRTRLCRQKTTGTHRRFQVAVPGCVGRRPLEHTGVSRWPYQAVSAEDHWNTQAFPGGRTRLCQQKTTGTHRRFQVAVPGCVGRRPLEHTGVSRWPYQAVSAEDHWNTQAFP